MKFKRFLLVAMLVLALAAPLAVSAEPVITGAFQDTVKLLNSAQGDDGSYTQMYCEDEIYILCGREPTYYELDDAVKEKLSAWYSEVETPDVTEDITIDGVAARHVQLSLNRGEKPTQVDLFCLREDDWLLYVEFTYPQAQADAIAEKLQGWIDSLDLVNGDFGEGDLQWNEVSMYTDVAGESMFPTLGDLADWAVPYSFSWKAAEGGALLTMNVAGGEITVLAEDNGKVFSGDEQNAAELPAAARKLGYTLRQLVWTSDEFVFDPPRGFQPGTNIQSLFDSFPDAMIQMVTNSQYGFTQSVELSTKNPDDGAQKATLVFYGADAVIRQVVFTVK